MRFVNKNTVNTQFLKRDDIILAALVVQLCKFCLDGFFALFHLLNAKAFAIVVLQFFDPVYQLLFLLRQHIDLPLRAHRDFFKLAVADNHSVVIPCGDTTAKPFSSFGFKIFPCRYEDVGRWIKLQIL